MSRKVANPEFQAFHLNEEGRIAVSMVRREFDELLTKITEGPEPLCVPGRELSIVKTKLEEACMFAVKAVAKQERYQEKTG